jgi:SAM-dependent methyltransferase
MDTERVTQVGRTVREFYETYSFPGYEELETAADLVRKAKQSGYAELLDAQLALGINVLEVGCGTGQLSAFLSMTNRTAVGVDFSLNSLRKGAAFAARCGLRNAHFAQMDLFRLAFPDNAFDVVICSGVLHHTADAERGFQSVCRVLKPGGYALIGLYNTYGRAMTTLRQWMVRLSGGRGRPRDTVLRQEGLDEAKRRVWFMDQYRHPHEQVFTVGDVLGWFARAGIDYVNSIPAITGSGPGSEALASGRLWEPADPGRPLEQLIAQLGWVFTTGHEGGLFLTIGRKQP